jgi:hypothetical protein
VTPPTGDDTCVAAWIGLMGLSALGIVLMLAVMVHDREKGRYEC